MYPDLQFYFKLLLHVSNIFFQRLAWTPPQKATSGEQGKYAARNQTKDFLPGITTWHTPTLRITLYIISTTEIYLLLCNTFPSIINRTALTFLSVTPYNISNISAAPPTFVLGCLLLGLGATLRAACYRFLGKNFTFELALRKEHQLCTDGPYSFVRHPSYTGLVLATIGHTLCILGPGSWWAECHAYYTPIGKLVAAQWMVLAGVMLGMAFTRVGKEDAVLQLRS